MCETLKPSFLRANVDTDVTIRREQFEGVEHLVVPVIAAKEMVMNGFMYPAKEFSDWIETWNGIPVPVAHPQVNGMHVSARDKSMQEKTSVGTFFNVEFTKDNKLKGEIWLNIDKAEKLGASYIIDRFESGEIMEVSTGLYSNIDMQPGEFDGVPYQGIIRHIRPDHLALLPNEVGACSLKDGCGAMRNNCGCESEVKESCSCSGENKVKDNIGKALKLIAEKFGLNKTTEDNTESNKEEKTDKEADLLEVVRNTSQKPVLVVNNEEDTDMSEEVKKIEEEIKEEISTEEVQEETTEEVTEEVSTEEESEETESKEEEESEEQKVNSVLSNLEDEAVKEFLGNAVKEFSAKKESLIKEVVANSEFSEEEVKSFKFDHIEKLAKSLKSNTKEEKKGSYAGSRGASVTANESVYVAPSIFDKKEKK